MTKIVFIDWSGEEIAAPFSSDDPRADFLKAIEMLFRHQIKAAVAVKLVHPGNVVDSTFSINEKLYENLKPRKLERPTATRLRVQASQYGRRLPSIRTSVKI